MNNELNGVNIHQYASIYAVGTERSSPAKCTSGVRVPQGSVLRPLILAMYISPMSNVVAGAWQKAETQKAESQNATLKRQKLKWPKNQKAEKSKGRKSIGSKSKGRN